MLCFHPKKDVRPCFCKKKSLVKPLPPPPPSVTGGQADYFRLSFKPPAVYTIKQILYHQPYILHSNQHSKSFPLKIFFFRALYYMVNKLITAF